MQPAENSGLRRKRPARYGCLTPLRRKEPSVFDNKIDAIASAANAGFVGVFTA
jgi:hypothetical protein